MFWNKKKKEESATVPAPKSKIDKLREQLVGSGYIRTGEPLTYEQRKELNLNSAPKYYNQQKGLRYFDYTIKITWEELIDYLKKKRQLCSCSLKPFHFDTADNIEIGYHPFCTWWSPHNQHFTIGVKYDEVKYKQFPKTQTDFGQFYCELKQQEREAIDEMHNKQQTQ